MQLDLARQDVAKAQASQEKQRNELERAVIELEKLRDRYEKLKTQSEKMEKDNEKLRMEVDSCNKMSKLIVNNKSFFRSHNKNEDKHLPQIK